MKSSWKPGPDKPRLGDQEVHVWRSSLALPDAIRSQLNQALSQKERERAARFATDKLRHRYVFGRGVLRDLLGRYLDKPPGDLQFRYGDHEKPYLIGETAEGALHFNVSHSRDLALFGFSRGREIGVDLEWIRTDLEQEAISSRFFSANESARVQSLPPEERFEYFFALWTCKEAFVKANGGGLSFGLDRFDVQLEPGAGSALIVGNEKGDELSPWFACRLDPGNGFTGALAVEERDLSISLWDWPPTSPRGARV